MPSPAETRTVPSELPQHSLPLPFGSQHKPFGATSYVDFTFAHFIFSSIHLAWALESEFVSQLCHLLTVRSWRLDLISLSLYL